jgi:para-nitrobenzyl esterase
MAQGLSSQVGVPLSDGAAWQKLPMDQLIGALRSVYRPFRPVLDMRTFTRHPFDPDAPPTAVGIPFMTGNTATETWHALRADPRNFSLQIDDVENRLDRFLHLNRAGTRRVLDVARGLNPSASPSDLLAMITTEQMYVRNTTRGALLQSRNHAPVYSYIFAWETPVDGGRWHSPHGLELPFLFGLDTYEFMTGTGPQRAPLSAMMVATWTAFAHTGNPNNRFLPQWPRFDGVRQAKMVLNLPSRAVDHHGQVLRNALKGVPYFEYTEGGNFVRP